MTRSEATRRSIGVAVLGTLLFALGGSSSTAGVSMSEGGSAASRPRAGERTRARASSVTHGVEPTAIAEVVAPPAGDMASIPAGDYLPLYASSPDPSPVAAFRLDRRPVTRGQLLDFLRANPDWRKSRVRPVFAGPGYLADWPADLEPPGGASGDAELDAPATSVSWFAAKAYCRWRGGRLPSVDEWEYVALADEERRDASDDPTFRARVLELATSRAGVADTFENIYGVRGLHGPLREWVADFNSVMVSDDSRGAGARDQQLYCAASANGATDTEDYAAFLRYAFRASLEPRSAAGALGFRCAADLRDR